MMAETNKKLIFCAFISVVTLLYSVFPNQAVAAYSDSLVISDAVFTAKDSMSADDINNFFKDHGQLSSSWMYNYVIGVHDGQPDGTERVTYPLVGGDGNVTIDTVDVPQNNGAGTVFAGRTIAQLIYDECQQHNINPRVLIAMLEKESWAVTMNSLDGYHTADDFKVKHPTLIAWPLFYYYDERMGDCLAGVTSKCSDPGYLGNGPYPTYKERTLDFGGVGQQIAYATYSLQSNFNKFTANPNIIVNGDSSSKLYCNNSSCANAATRTLFNYTPHPQTNFYDIFSRWFGDPVVGISNPTPPKPVKPGDGNGDDVVDIKDLSILSDNWGKGVSAGSGGDFNSDGTVDIKDLSILSDNWGK